MVDGGEIDLVAHMHPITEMFHNLAVRTRSQTAHSLDRGIRMHAITLISLHYPIDTDIAASIMRQVDSG